MRIGIVTLPLHYNYGGILQAYALQTVLERMGHEVVVFNPIRKENRLPLWRTVPALGKRVLKRYLLGKREQPILLERKLNREYGKVTCHVRQFMDRYIHIKYIEDFKALSSADYDAIVVGSDQVWRPKYFVKMFAPIEDAYLEFAKDWQIKRIAYAVSFGTGLWEYTPAQTKRCARLLDRFDAVSVREDSGEMLCQEFLGREAQFVLDPTLLLDTRDYIRLFERENLPTSEGSLFVYILDDAQEKRALVNHVAALRSLIPFSVNSRIADSCAPMEERIHPPVEKWLKGIYESDYVVTDSFHACVFSILFRKNFLVYGNCDRGMARFKSLLGMFGLEDRLVKEVNDPIPGTEIDYDKVYAILGRRREYALDFLRDALCSSNHSG